MPDLPTFLPNDSPTNGPTYPPICIPTYQLLHDVDISLRSYPGFISCTTWHVRVVCPGIRCLENVYSFDPFCIPKFRNVTGDLGCYPSYIVVDTRIRFRVEVENPVFSFIVEIWICQCVLGNSLGELPAKKWCSKRDINNKVGKESSRNVKLIKRFFLVVQRIFVSRFVLPQPNLSQHSRIFDEHDHVVLFKLYIVRQGSSTFASHRLKPLSSPVATS